MPRRNRVPESVSAETPKAKRAEKARRERIEAERSERDRPSVSANTPMLRREKEGVQEAARLSTGFRIPFTDVHVGAVPKNQWDRMTWEERDEALQMQQDAMETAAAMAAVPGMIMTAPAGEAKMADRMLGGRKWIDLSREEKLKIKSATGLEQVTGGRPGWVIETPVDPQLKKGVMDRFLNWHAFHGRPDAMPWKYEGGRSASLGQVFTKDSGGFMDSLGDRAQDVVLRAVDSRKVGLEGAAGAYAPAEGELRLTERATQMKGSPSDSLRSIAIHELQHVEQHIDPSNLKLPYGSRPHEIEARAVAERWNMTPEQRTKSLIEDSHPGLESWGADFYDEVLQDQEKLQLRLHKQQDAKGGNTRSDAKGGDARDVRMDNDGGKAKPKWTWETYRWHPKNGRIDPKNIKGTGVAFDERDRATLPKELRKEFEAWMDELADPKGEWTLDDGQKVKPRSALVPKDWRTDAEYNRDYDFVRAFLAAREDPELAKVMVAPVDHGEEGYWLHMNDVGKLPTHPTFSRDSYYAQDPKYAPLAGSWEGEEYAPGEAERAVHEDAKGGDAPGESGEPVPQGGPAQEGGPRIVINPSTFRNEKDALCVAFNEAFRLVMEEMGFDPVAEPTDAQRKFFSDTAYADDELQLRRTILARICTFDTSVKDPTDEQLQEAVEFLSDTLEAGAPQNEWEQQAVMRLRDVISHVSARGTKGDQGANAPAESPQASASASSATFAASPETPATPETMAAGGEQT